MGKTKIMIDIVDIKQAVKHGDIAFYMNEGVIYCKDTTTEEVVKVGEMGEEVYRARWHDGNRVWSEGVDKSSTETIDVVINALDVINKMQGLEEHTHMPVVWDGRRYEIWAKGE